jgi:hypothetical protein
MNIIALCDSPNFSRKKTVENKKSGSKLTHTLAGIYDK